MNKAIPIEVVQRRIAEIDERLQEVDRLRDERRILQELLQDAVALSASPTGKPFYANLGPKEAILALLKNESNLTTRDVMDRLEGNVASSASNVRRTLYQTVLNLQREGVIQKVVDGVLRVMA